MCALCTEGRGKGIVIRTGNRTLLGSLLQAGVSINSSQKPREAEKKQQEENQIQQNNTSPKQPGIMMAQQA